MNIEQLREFCLSLPNTTEDVKWGNDLCFCIGKKMFAVTGVDSISSGISFKCTPEKFAELTEVEGIRPAAYVARYHWVSVEDLGALSSTELKELIRNSYQLVRDKLPAKLR
ncbi:MAG: MmcQ/YjbR family DNA-binding protein [Pyrinomonadaceae bacterium]